MQVVNGPHFETHCFQDTGLLSLEGFKLSLKVVFKAVIPKMFWAMATSQDQVSSLLK